LLVQRCPLALGIDEMVLEGQKEKETGHVLEEDLPGLKAVELIAPTLAFKPSFSSPSFVPCLLLFKELRVINTNIATNLFSSIDSA